MADATERRAKGGLVAGKGDAANVKALVSTIELASTTSGGTIDFGDIPADARISGLSTVYWDDLATSGSPTLDLGLVAVDGNLVNADDPDALSDGHDVTTAGSGDVIGDKANFGLPAWDFVASESEDPGGALTVQGQIKDAPTNATGTVTLELLYYMD